VAVALATEVPRRGGTDRCRLRSGRSVVGLRGRGIATGGGVARRQQLLERRGAQSDLAVVLSDGVVAGSKRCSDGRGAELVSTRRCWWVGAMQEA